MFELPNDNPVPQPKTCWKNRTPFQMGLILMLAVAIPFFIAMIVIYVVYGIILGENSEKCANMCQVLHMAEFRDSKNSMANNISFLSAMRPKRAMGNDCSKYPQIGALVENLYTDDEKDLIFKCSVVVLSPTRVITVEECLNGTTNPLVRINSNYWSQGGVIKKVKRVVMVEGCVMMHLEQDLSYNEDCFTFKKTMSISPQVFYWNGDLNRALAKKKKFAKLTGVNVQVESLKREFSFEDLENCRGEVGAPVFDGHQKLIGFQISNSCEQKVLIYRATVHFD